MSSPQSDSSNSACKPSAEHLDLGGSGSHLPPRKRARTEAEKEQRRVERIIRNRKAAHASREKKRKHVEQLESYVKMLEFNLNLSLETNKTLLSKLAANSIACDSFDLKSLQIQRPDGLVLSDEDESCVANNSNSSEDGENNTPNAGSIKSENEDGIEQSDKCSNDDDADNVESVSHPEIKIEEEEDEEEELNNSVLDEIPVLSRSSPSSVSGSEFSSPPTPGNDANLFSLDRDQRDFNLLITNTNDFMDLNSYLEPEFSTSDFNEIDQSLDFKSHNEHIDGNGHNTMGYLSSYNSVHSAVMHIFPLQLHFGFPSNQ